MATSATPIERLAYSPREVAETLGLAISTVRQMIYDGKLDAARVGGRILVSTDEVRRLVTDGSS